MSVTKDIIETNKLYTFGGNAIEGLCIGSPTAESKYAVITDEHAQKTVIYDKVHYEFGVNDIYDTVPASGGTYNITASVSTRTHGDGTVENITFSPSAITIPENTGASYTSSVTITQGSSNLTQSCSFTVEADSVTAITLSLGAPSTISAAGGSVNNTTYSVTAY